MSFHRMVRGEDAFGILPTVFAVDKHGKRDRRTFATDKIGAQPKPIRLEQTTFRQGPLRHPDFVEWSGDGSPFGYYFVASPRVHELLSAAQLPAHEVHDVIVQWPNAEHRKHGQGESEYLLYVFDKRHMLDVFDLASTGLSCTVQLLSERMNQHVELQPGAVTTSAEAWAKAVEACPPGQRPLALPTALLSPVDEQFARQIDFESAHFPITTKDVDLMFLEHTFEPWLSDGLRTALEAMEATGFSFAESWDDTRLVSPAGDRRAADLMALALARAGAPASDPTFARYQERRLDVLSRSDRVLELRPEPRDWVGQLEVDLDVEFPPTYRACLLADSFPSKGRFRFLPAEQLNTLDEIDPDWTAKSAPQAVRALMVAVDDGGDYLGYMLREDSLTQLDEQLMHFHHETTEVTRSRVRLKPPPEPE